MQTTRAIGVLMALALIFAVPGIAPAQDAGGTAAPSVAPDPQTLSDDNPYKARVEAARKAADDALYDLQKIVRGMPFDFEKQIDAYYAWLKAEAAHRTILQKALEWENAQKPVLAGKVVGPVRITLPVGFVLPGKRDAAIAGAAVTVRPRLLWIMRGQPGTAAEEPPATEGVATTDEARPAIFPPPPISKKVYTAETGKDGKFRIQDIEPGSYWITVSKKGYQTTQMNLEVKKTGETNVRVRLEGLNVLTGTVRTLPKGDRSLLAQARVAGDRPFVPPPDKKLPIVAGAEVTLSTRILVGLGRPAAAEGSDGSDSPASTAAEDTTADASGRIVAPDFPRAYRATTNKRGVYRLENVPDGRYLMRVEKKGLSPFEATVSVSKDLQTQDVVLLPPFPGIDPVPVPVPQPRAVGAEEEAMDQPTGASLDNPFESQ